MRGTRQHSNRPASSWDGGAAIVGEASGDSVDALSSGASLGAGLPVGQGSPMEPEAGERRGGDTWSDMALSGWMITNNLPLRKMKSLIGLVNDDRFSVGDVTMRSPRDALACSDKLFWTPIFYDPFKEFRYGGLIATTCINSCFAR